MYVVWKFDWLPDFVAGGGYRGTERCCCEQKQTSRSVMDSERGYATANANSEAQKKRQLLSPPMFDHSKRSPYPRPSGLNFILL